MLTFLEAVDRIQKRLPTLPARPWRSTAPKLHPYMSSRDRAALDALQDFDSRVCFELSWSEAGAKGGPSLYIDATLTDDVRMLLRFDALDHGLCTWCNTDTDLSGHMHLFRYVHSRLIERVVRASGEALPTEIVYNLTSLAMAGVNDDPDALFHLALEQVVVLALCDDAAEEESRTMSGSACSVAAQFAEANGFLEEACALYRHALGLLPETYAHRADVLYCAASAECRFGDYDRAEELFLATWRHLRFDLHCLVVMIPLYARSPRLEYAAKIVDVVNRKLVRALTPHCGSAVAFRKALDALTFGKEFDLEALRFDELYRRTRDMHDPANCRMAQNWVLAFRKRLKQEIRDRYTAAECARTSTLFPAASSDASTYVPPTAAELEKERERKRRAQEERERREREERRLARQEPCPTWKKAPPRKKAPGTYVLRWTEREAERRVKKAASLEAQRAHQRALKEREESRVAELEERARLVRIGDRIGHGD